MRLWPVLLAGMIFACEAEHPTGPIRRPARSPRLDAAAFDVGVQGGGVFADVVVADVRVPDADRPDAGFPARDAMAAPDAGFMPGDPAGRTVAEVCEAWRMGHVENDPRPWTAGADRCEAGTLSQGGIDDTVRRVNMYRWLAGLGPVTDDPAQNPGDQLCAVIMNANGRLSHMPPMSWNCWSSDGARAAGRSNIAIGTSNSADAINLYMVDRNTPSLGHRRWILNGRLGKVGIGFAGRGQCLGVFDRSGSRNHPDWTAYPNQGPAPRSLMGATWSFHSNSFSLSSADVTVVKSDGTAMPITVNHPGNGFGPSTVSWDLDGWTARPGERYRITVSGFNGGPVTYEVLVADC